MDRASTFAFPGGRTLASWQRQLAPLRPKAFWVGHWFVHRVEALARHDELIPLDSLASFLLRACKLEGASSAKVEAIANRLRMPIPLISGWLRQLAHQGMIQTPFHDEVALTATGLEAVQRGVIAKPTFVRKTFSFVERLRPDGTRRAEPHYLPIAETQVLPWLNPEPLGFDPRWLGSCAEMPAEWKERFQFPLEVQGFSLSNGTLRETAKNDWQKILLDRTDRIPVLLIQVEAEGQGRRWLALAWRGEGWILFDSSPVWQGGDEIAEVFQEVGEPPRIEEWREVWLQWCRQRSLSGPEADQTELTWSDGRLLVKPPLRMVQRLQANKSDLFKGEAWLLANEGYLRAAAPLVLVDVPTT